MNRRKFITMMGLAPVVAKAAPLLKLIPPAPVQATISQYYDYCTFSEVVSETAIDPIVDMTAIELGKRHYANVDNLFAEAFA